MLVALEGIGTRLTFSRNQEIYIEGDASDCWYKVVSGTVRICKLLADGRRHIAEVCFSGDCFDLDSTGSRVFSAEAVSDAIVLRLPQGHRAVDGPERRPDAVAARDHAA
ncbi:MAG: cyclic nucleotide-binding domain-containing protein [Alphaproteobacteria bacterium]|nr:cyclic nucleotide-binding domain-containing protein [Alphaproteobacteria bacterium]